MSMSFINKWMLYRLMPLNISSGFNEASIFINEACPQPVFETSGVATGGKRRQLVSHQSPIGHPVRSMQIRGYFYVGKMEIGLQDLLPRFTCTDATADVLWSYPRPTGVCVCVGGGYFEPPLVFLRYLLNQCRHHHKTCSTLSRNNFTHCVQFWSPGYHTSATNDLRVTSCSADFDRKYGFTGIAVTGAVLKGLTQLSIRFELR